MSSGRGRAGGPALTLRRPASACRRRRTAAAPTPSSRGSARRSAGGGRGRDRGEAPPGSARPARLCSARPAHLRALPLLQLLLGRPLLGLLQARRRLPALRPLLPPPARLHGRAGRAAPRYRRDGARCKMAAAGPRPRACATSETGRRERARCRSAPWRAGGERRGGPQTHRSPAHRHARIYCTALRPALDIAPPNPHVTALPPAHCQPRTAPPHAPPAPPNTWHGAGQHGRTGAARHGGPHPARGLHHGPSAPNAPFIAAAGAGPDPRGRVEAQDGDTSRAVPGTQSRLRPAGINTAPSRCHPAGSC